MCGLRTPTSVHKIDIARGVQKEPWFLRMNPLAGTFAWTNLASKALEEAQNGLTKETGKALYRAWSHTRRRRLAREDYMWTEEYEAQKRRWLKSGTRDSWEYREFPGMNHFEQSFASWYARAVADDYCARFNAPEEFEQIWREFGGSGWQPPARVKLYLVQEYDGEQVVKQSEGPMAFALAGGVGEPALSLPDSVSLNTQAGRGRREVVQSDVEWAMAEDVV